MVRETSDDDTTKRQHGQYFTMGNCFGLTPFRDWFESIPHHETLIITEPFAGGGDIPSLMNAAGYNNKFVMYDIYPKKDNIIQRDSIQDCPITKCIITNPPYLAKNSATRRGLSFPNTHYDDIYKLALEVMLERSPYIAAIIPESFITAGLFTDRLVKIVSIKIKMFSETDCPVCLAMFSPKSNGVEIYDDSKFIGNLSELQTSIPSSQAEYSWDFNNVDGDIGIIAVDNQKTDSIRFVLGTQISPGDVKSTSRSKTRVKGDGIYNAIDLIKVSNKLLKEIRTKTHDTTLTAFKGIREDGKYRRRLDFATARVILNCAREMM